MKIQTLHIQNIASIEEATIDFDKGILAAEPIFLICGETGSGKTTILNAICLALYKRVPYFDTVGDDEKGKSSAAKRGDSGNWLDQIIHLDQIKNPEQLLRRGTLSGEASLSFVGNDGHSYIATWEAHPNKQDKSKIKSTHTIYDSTAKVTYKAVKDINKVIEQAVGLNFDQFCRTTMLAQGQFSKFICAKDDEKEAILEKLTATERFSVYGAAIHERYIGIKRQCDILAAVLNETHLLTDAEIEEINANIAQLRIQIQTDEAKQKVEQAKIDWLTRNGELMASHTAEQAKLDLLKARRESSEYADMVSLVNDWDATVSVRADIAHRDAANMRLGDDEASLQAMNSAVGRLFGAVKGLEEHINKLKDRLLACQNAINAYQAHEPMIENSAALLRELDNLSVLLHDSQKLHDNIPALQDSLTKAAKKRDALNETKIIAQELARTKKEAADKTAKEAKNANLSALDDEIKKLESRRELLSRAKINLNAISDYSEKVATANDKISETDQNINAEMQLVNDLEGKIPQIQAVAAKLEGEFQGKLDLKNALASIRRRFAETHECPLCGSSVEHLHTDEVLEGSLAVSLDKADKARADVNAAKSALAQAKGAIKALTQSRTSLAKDAETNSAKLKEAQSQLTSAYASCPSTTAEIDEQLARADLERTAKISDREKATGCINAHNEALKALERANADLLKAEKALLRASESANKRQAEIEANDEAIKNSEASIAAAKQYITATATIEISDLTTDDHCAAAKTKITKVVAEYKKALADKDTVDAEIQKAEQKISSCQIVANRLKDLFPQAMRGDSELIDDVDKALAETLQQASSLRGSIALTKQNIAEAQARISAYFAQPDCVKDERVAQLAAIPKGECSAARKSISELNDAENRAKGALERLDREITAHAEKRPELAEEDTTDTISSALANLGKEISRSQESVAQLRQRLSDDTEKRQRMQEKLTEKAQMDQLREKWLALDRLYGGEKGVNFRRIAQIHVLANLLQRANYFLKDLDDRYRLTSSGMSLNIYVTDRHIDAAPRAVNSLSGGEGFLASLALALALSTISKERIDIDILFIDEGFGTLSPGPLDKAMNTLRKLSATGNRRVGIISHVEALRAVVPAKIQLERTTRSTSRLRITGH